MPPTVVNQTGDTVRGQLPDKEGCQMYHCGMDDLFILFQQLSMPVTNIYRDVILSEDQLPIKNCAYNNVSVVAGSYGKDVRD